MPKDKLSGYPRPNVAVDIAVLTVAGGRLCVVLTRDDDGHAALPGRFVRKKRTVEQTVREVLDRKLGLAGTDIAPHLLAVFSDPDRDPRGWTMSVAHAVALPVEALTDVDGELAPLTPDGRLESGETLLYDHDAIVAAAVGDLRRHYEDRPDPDGLLRPPFTLTDLREVHEAVLGRRLMRDSFNRRVEPLLEVETDADGTPVTRVGGGRPARLFRLPEEPSSFGWRLPSVDGS